jgi:hypothetical protein
VVESTHGDEHGWHPHRHVLVLLDGPVSQDMLDELAGRWFARWERALARKGFSAVERSGGLDARVVAADGSGGLGLYLSKVALEVTGSAHKRGRGGNRAPFEILRDFLAWGNADDYDLWAEFEQTAQRRRTVTWAGGTRERFGVEVVSDEEIAEEELTGAEDDVLALPSETWRAVRADSDALLVAAERDGAVGAAVWLTGRGLSWSWAVPAPRAERPSAAERRRQACLATS